MRLTYNSLYVFLFVFIYVSTINAVNRDHRPTMVGLVLLALALAAGVIIIGIALGEARKPNVVGRGLYAFLLLFLYFLFRLWIYSSYHPLPYPELWALVAATIAAIAESFRTETERTSGSKK